MSLLDAKDTVTILINIDILINCYQIVPILKRMEFPPKSGH